jgi:hypothetical protein
LHGDDLAAVLGVSRSQAHVLASRACGQFETSLGVLLVARSGRASCATLDELLAYWDGQLTPLLRKRLARHIQHCDICGQRRRRGLHPAAVLGLLPAAVLPAGLRDDVLRLVSSATPADIARRELIAGQADGFDPVSGFPVALDPPQPPPVADRRRHYAVAAVAAVALLCGFLIEMGVHHQHKQLTSQVALGSNTLAPQVTSPSGSAGPQGSAPATAGRHSQGPVSPGSPALISPVTTPTIVIVPGPHPPPPSSRPTQSHSPPPPSSPAATLSASSSTVGLGPDPGGTSESGSFTLTASGGTVSYSIAVPSGLSGLVVSPASGTLTAGSSVTITVTWNSTSPITAGLSISPGPLTVTVEYPQPPG